MSALATARYGKDLVRVFRTVRDPQTGLHTVAEYNITALVEGDIEASYTQGDNSVIVATDSIKNIINYLAKVSLHVLYPELFALEIGSYIIQKYPHLHKAFVDIEQLRWSRINVDGKPHPHSFMRDGDEKRTVSVVVDGTAGKDQMMGSITSGLKDLLVLKSTGSAFENFIRDEHTTLVEVNDRIFSTSVDLTYSFSPIALVTEGLGALEPAMEFEKVFNSARDITLEIFAIDDSASVQATLFKMGQQIIEKNNTVNSVTYLLPNKHYIPVNLSHVKLENMKPSVAEVFTPVSAPSGLISATITRSNQVEHKPKHS